MTHAIYKSLFFLLMVFSGCAAPRPQTVMYKEAKDVKRDKVSLDIYKNEVAPKSPVVVFVHGGGWLLGDKATKIRKKVKLFKDMGYVFVSVNYRLSSFFNKKIQYPVHTEDVADAIKWIYDHIELYGGDKGNIVLMGHSAGAQMISLLATSPGFLPARGVDPAALKGIISVDTEGYDVEEMAKAGAKIYLRIFGDAPQIWKAASPIFNIEANGRYPNFLVVKRGKPYRLKMAEDFTAKLEKAGTRVKLISGAPYSHFRVNNIIGSKKDTTVTPAIARFLKEVFK